MTRPCPIPGCGAKKPTWAFMCSTHWHMIPVILQNQVNHFNRHGKGGPLHRTACRKALEAVRAQLAARDAQRQAAGRERLPYADH